MKVGIIRGAFLNSFEFQNYLPLVGKCKITAFSSLRPINNIVGVPCKKIFSPVDLDFGVLNRFKMPFLNRMLIDAHWLIGLLPQIKGYDIVHVAETYYSYTFQSLIAQKIGYVGAVVSTVWENIPFNNQGIIGRKFYKNFAIKNVDKFIAVTTKAKESLIAEGCDSQKIKVVYPGVDINRFKPLKNNNTTMEVLFVGRLVEEKGVRELAGAIELLKDKKIVFKICGKGNCAGIFDRFLNVSVEDVEYGKMHRIYQHADIFILPSKNTKYWSEQLGMVLIEAMACGLPIITSNNGSIPEVVGDAALITEVTAYDIAKNIKKLLKDVELRRSLGHKARRRAVKFFDFNKQSAKIYEIYKEVYDKKVL